MPSSRERIALVIGAAGGIGGETAAALARHGRSVRALTRRPQPARQFHLLPYALPGALTTAFPPKILPMI